MSAQRKVPLLQGLSASDRELMLVMMAALGSAAQTMMTVSSALEKGHGSILALDNEANALIDIIKVAKDRLKPGHAVIVTDDKGRMN